MEEMQQITLEQWMGWKEDIRQKLTETAQNFVHIGFRLKQIRDSGMLGGAADIFGFAEKEYGLSKSSTSRFIAINEKFSEGGNSLELKEEYHAFGSSKLSEMLTLTDAECTMITEKTTIKQIRELKAFGRQEPEAVGEEERALDPLQKCIIDYFRTHRELDKILKAVHDGRYKEAMELMNPSGAGAHKKGLCFLFMYEWDTGIKYKLFPSPQPIMMRWEDFLLEVYDIYKDIYENKTFNVYSEYYQEKETEKTGNIEYNQGFEGSVATSQQEGKEEEKGEVETEGEEAEEDFPEPGAGSERDSAEPDVPDAGKDTGDGVGVEPGYPEDGAAGSGVEGISGSEDDSQEPAEDDGALDWEDSGEQPLNSPEISEAAAGLWERIEEAVEDVYRLVEDRCWEKEEAETALEFLKTAYGRAVDLAAGLEQLVIEYERQEG